MSKSFEAPPPVLDCARVVAYAAVDASVRFTGRCGMHSGGKAVGPVQRLAVCRNLTDGELLLLYCDDEWHSLAAAQHSSVEEAKAAAERSYSGIERRWRDLHASEEEVLGYLDQHWPACSFCSKRGFEVSLMVGESPRICSECIQRFHGVLQSRLS
jgi:hypothetical protein